MIHPGGPQKFFQIAALHCGNKWAGGCYARKSCGQSNIREIPDFVNPRWIFDLGQNMVWLGPPTRSW